MNYFAEGEYKDAVLQGLPERTPLERKENLTPHSLIQNVMEGEWFL